jgi:hypothetical protein
VLGAGCWVLGSGSSFQVAGWVSTVLVLEVRGLFVFLLSISTAAAHCPHTATNANTRACACSVYFHFHWPCLLCGTWHAMVTMPIITHTPPHTPDSDGG